MLPPPQSSPSPMLPFGVRRGRKTTVGSQYRSRKPSYFPCPSAPRCGPHSPHPRARPVVSRPRAGLSSWEMVHVLSGQCQLARTPTLTAPPLELEQRQRPSRSVARRGFRFRSAHETHSSFPPPTPQASREVAAINTITTPTKLANPLQLGAAEGAFLLALAALSPTAPRAPFFLQFFVDFGGTVCDVFVCCDAPQGPLCVSCVSVGGVGRLWCSKGPVWGSREPVWPPQPPAASVQGGEGGSEVLIGETTCGPGGPKLHRPSV